MESLEFQRRKLLEKIAPMMLGNRNGDQAIRRLIAQKVKIPTENEKKKLLDPAFDPNKFAKQGVDYIMY